MKEFIQILIAAAGSLGFGMVFRMRPSRLIWAALGGGLTWAVYQVCVWKKMDNFTANLTATVFASLWAEFLAHRCKAPAAIFTITALVPLIPGGMLYKTMSALVERHPGAAELGTETAMTAAALAFGMMLSAAVMHIITSIKSKKGKQESRQ